MLIALGASWGAKKLYFASKGSVYDQTAATFDHSSSRLPVLTELAEA